MRYSYVFWLLCFNGCAIGNVKGTTSSAIPELLYDCYRSNITTATNKPLSISTLIELIRKAELDNDSNFNMRIVATSMLHGLVFDGVRKSRQFEDDSVAIPYRANGEEFYKYRLIVDYLTAGESSQFPSESLTTPELCFLHRMISSTVDPWERGDESSTCVHQPSMPFEALEEDDEISACPIKQGVVKTKWGPVSAGSIIAGVASALEQSKESFQRIEAAINTFENKTVTNPQTNTRNITSNVNHVWVSTIAGDLAQVVLKQATTDMEIGSDGFWNDTLLPRVYYLKSPKWDTTEAEILGGIDALAIAEYITKTAAHDKLKNMRLSQLIDKYYSEQGIENHREYSVTNRAATLNRLLNEINLQEQISGTAGLLKKIGTYNSFLNDSSIEMLASVAAEKFRVYAENITRVYDSVEYINGKSMNASVEIIAILDGTFEPYSAQQMISTLCESVQVSRFGSKLGIINGQSGNWMANVTGEQFQIFTDLQSADEWPNTMTLSRSLETVIYYYQNQSDTECSKGFLKPKGRAILIVAPASRLTDDDVINSQRLIRTLKNANPDINLLFVTTPEQNSTLSTQFAGNLLENDAILTPPQDVLSFVEHISRSLSDIPRNIINFYCNQSQVHLEDYITPDVQSVYLIRKEYLQRAHIKVNFISSNYGDLSICVLSNSIKRLCQNLTVDGQISFNSREQCAPESVCNLQFQVSLENTKDLCIEKDCAFLDQVRLDVNWERSSGSISVGLHLHYLLAIFYVIFLINK